MARIGSGIQPATAAASGFLAVLFASIFTLPALADTNFTVTARNWNLWHSYSFYNGESEFQTNEEAFFIPMVGGSGTLSGDWLPRNSSLSLTVLYGEGKRDFSENRVSFAVPANTSQINGHDEVERLDVEAIWQFPVGKEGASLFGGVRYIGFDQEGYVDNVLNAGGRTSFTNWKRNTIDVNSWYAEFGGGLSDALDEDKRHLLFGNLTLSLGKEFQEVDIFNSDGSRAASYDTEDTVFGIDTNFGYALRLGEQTTFSSRYRLFIAGPTENWSTDGNSVIHGPELQLSHRF